MERGVDARMARTRARPLPDGRLQPGDALVFGLLTTAAGLAYLGLTVGGPTTVVTLVIAVLYLGAYTPLKLVTPLCLVIGAVPGALPPVAGWVSARGEVGPGAFSLFAILFLWQLPHTLAIARVYRDDYARAGIRVLPVVDPTGGSTERQIVTGCLALLVAGLLPTLVGVAGGVYFFGALALGAGFLACGMLQALAPSVLAARRLVVASVLYLPVLLVLMALDKIG
jgi:protoheme IX farnesyltransferase